MFLKFNFTWKYILKTVNEFILRLNPHVELKINILEGKVH